MNIQFILFTLCMLAHATVTSAQLYTSYFTGSPFDVPGSPEGGICMMGGASEHDNAMRWFLERASGGDILVLRASGSDGYNDYLYSELGVSVNSVETIVCHSSSASYDAYVQNRILSAEGIWFAGGDQWDYVSFWRNTPVDSLINDALQNRNIVIGGTSAGMAILGRYYFSAQNGSVTSATALSNPYDSHVVVDSSSFLHVNYLNDVITDSHYADRNRQGRHIVFVARVLTDYSVAAKGIACNEYTAMCIDSDGQARVFGDYPSYPETAYFLQTNCELDNFYPEVCSESNPLDWNLGGQAIRVCKVHGTNDGLNTFDLTDWKTDSNGIWENWYVDNGTWLTFAGVPINCDSVSFANETAFSPESTDLLAAYPNPFNTTTRIRYQLSKPSIIALTVFDILGREISTIDEGYRIAGSRELRFNGTLFNSGVYFVRLEVNSTESYWEKLLLIK